MEDKEGKTKRIDSKEDLRKANERRIEELLNIDNRYVRTERHLEQHTDIADPERIEHAYKIQDDRENRMENLKDIIANDINEDDDNIENLEKRIKYTEGYLRNNEDDMDNVTLQNTIEKQKNRMEQLENMRK